MLGDLFFYNKKYSKAKKYYEMLHNNSDGRIIFNLCYCYYFIDKNYSKAYEMFEESLNHDYSLASIFIGMFYIYGIVVEQSYQFGTDYLEYYYIDIQNKFMIEKKLPSNYFLTKEILHFESSEIVWTSCIPTVIFF